MVQGYGTLQEAHSGSWPSLIITSSSDDEEETRSSSRCSPPPSILSHYSAQDPNDGYSSVELRPCFSHDYPQDSVNDAYSKMADGNVVDEQYAKFLMYEKRYQRSANRYQNFEHFLELEYTLNQENTKRETSYKSGDHGIIRMGLSSLLCFTSYMFMVRSTYA